jgi:LysM repeat protein
MQSKCDISRDTSIPPSLIIKEPEDNTPFYLSNVTYTTVKGDTYTSIALDFSVASAALYISNQDLIRDCTRPVTNQKLCIPLSCQYTHVLQDNNTCDSIKEANFKTIINPTTGRAFSHHDINPWINPFYINLHDTSTAHGHVLCLTTQGGVYNATNPSYGSGHDPNPNHSRYGSYLVKPPANTTVAEGTTIHCGKWHTAAKGETCPAIYVQAGITHLLFITVNPSLPSDSVTCSGSVVPGLTYCTAPLRGWNYTVSGI